MTQIQNPNLSLQRGELRFCNCCGILKPVFLVSTPDIVFCKKCAHYNHRNLYYTEDGGCQFTEKRPRYRRN